MTELKNYSLKQLENFLYDAMSTESSPQEIYDVIRGVVQDNYNVYKKQTEKAFELLALLNGNGERNISGGISRGNKIHQAIDDCMPPWGHSDMEALKYTDEEMDAMCAVAEEEEYLISKGYFKENGFWQKPKTSWIVKIEMDGLTGDAYIPVPDDLSDIVGWDVDDGLEWHHQGDGSYILRKVAE